MGVFGGVSLGVRKADIQGRGANVLYISSNRPPHRVTEQRTRRPIDAHCEHARDYERSFHGLRTLSGADKSANPCLRCTTPFTTVRINQRRLISASDSCLPDTNYSFRPSYVCHIRSVRLTVVVIGA